VIIIYNEIALMKQEVLLVKRTYQPNKRKKMKKHGFLSRIKSGVAARRRRKGRERLSK
jgi:large subunit ribosomal protein L34